MHSSASTLRDLQVNASTLLVEMNDCGPGPQLLVGDPVVVPEVCMHAFLLGHGCTQIAWDHRSVEFVGWLALRTCNTLGGPLFSDAP